MQGRIQDFKKERALVILVAKQLAALDSVVSPILAFASRRLANTYVIIPLVFAL